MLFELGYTPLPDGYGEILLPLEDCKRYLSLDLDDTEFDDLIPALRDAGIDFVEQFCSVRLGVVEGLIWTAQELPGCSTETVSLGLWPVTQIEAIGWIGSDNVAVVADPADYRFTSKGVVRPTVGGSWPSSVGGDVEIAFTAGFADGGAPPALLQAVRMFMAHLFANREGVATGSIGGEVPLGVKEQCARYRLMVV